MWRGSKPRWRATTPASRRPPAIGSGRVSAMMRLCPPASTRNCPQDCSTRTLSRTSIGPSMANSGGRRRDEWLEELPPDEVSELEGLDASWEAQYAREDAAAAEAAEAAE